IDKKLKTPKNYAVWDGSYKTIFICETLPEGYFASNQIFESIDFSKNIATQICAVLYKHQLLSVIIEGGAKIIQTFISEDMWDEARVFKGRINFIEGIKSPKISGRSIFETNILEDNLKIYFNV